VTLFPGCGLPTVGRGRAAFLPCLYVRRSLLVVMDRSLHSYKTESTRRKTEQARVVTWGERPKRTGLQRPCRGQPGLQEGSGRGSSLASAFSTAGRGRGGEARVQIVRGTGSRR